MRKDIHPDYHPVLYVDPGAEFEFVGQSTMKTEETRTIDGVDHYVVRLEISSASHPFFTGKQHFVDTAGRIEKFRQRFGSRSAVGGSADADSQSTDSQSTDSESTDSE
jgi:large subunit ribosomal protein L31